MTTFTLISSTKVAHTDGLDRNISKWDVVVNDGTQDHAIEAYVNHDNDDWLEYEVPAGLSYEEEDELFFQIVEATAPQA